MDKFILNWQDPETRRWHSVGVLYRFEDKFGFAYTSGSKESPRFRAFGAMNDLESFYVSDKLFPIFANRILSPKRPEYQNYARWSGFDEAQACDPLLMMARLEGRRETDNLSVYPVPKKTLDGKYETVFFCNGMNYLPKEIKSNVLSFDKGELLYPMLDILNPHDQEAVALRSSDPGIFLGYCPRYVAKDIAKLCLSTSGVEIRVRSVNEDAPPQLRLLCEVSCKWPNGFTPCESADQKVLASFDIARYFSNI